MKIGILGLGKLGEALVSGLLSSEVAKKSDLSATTRTDESAKNASKRLGIQVHTDNAQCVSESDVVILSVKPHQAEEVLKQVSGHFKKNALLISVCASITNRQLSEFSGGKIAVIRAMPNTPSVIREGMTVFAPGQTSSDAHIKTASRLFAAVGQVTTVDEKLMDGVTGLSGCGPAYGYLIIEALSEAGVKVGIPREKATLLAAQTLLGAAKMVLERGEHPASLKDEVTTPAGCTIDGLMALEEGKLRVTLIKAVLAATKRSEKLRD